MVVLLIKIAVASYLSGTVITFVAITVKSWFSNNNIQIIEPAPMQVPMPVPIQIPTVSLEMKELQEADKSINNNCDICKTNEESAICEPCGCRNLCNDCVIKTINSGSLCSVCKKEITIFLPLKKSQKKAKKHEKDA